MNYRLKDTLIWLGITLVTGFSFFLNYNAQFSGPVKAIVWLLWFVTVMLSFYFTTYGRYAYDFSLEAKTELLKVVWPTRQETIQTTMIVMVMVTFTGFILWGVDSLMMWIISKIAHLS